MADPDTNYLTNAEVGASFFNGQTVPGDNTITEANNLALKNRVDYYINTQVLLRKVAGNATDTSGTLKSLAYILYQQARNGEPLDIPKAEKRRARSIINGVHLGFSDTRNYVRGEHT
jgi:hypothetical protein